MSSEVEEEGVSVDVVDELLVFVFNVKGVGDAERELLLLMIGLNPPLPIPQGR
jgi:hypothetical protein